MKWEGIFLLGTAISSIIHPKKPINPENRKTHQNNSKSKLGKKENHEKQTLGSWLTAAPVFFQAPRTGSTTSLAVSFGVWCGGGLGKQRTTQPQSRKQRARQELFLLRNRSAPAIYVVVVEVLREGSRGMAWRKQRLWAWTFFLRSFCFFKWWAWSGKHLLAGVKPVFYATVW